MQMNLPFEEGKPIELRKNSLLNKIDLQDHAFHNWYRFVLSFPPHLVRDYIQKFGLSNQDTILDPFCGTGTTLVEAKLNGINSVGIEANPIAHLASYVKVDWNLDPEELVQHARIVAESALEELKIQTTARYTLSPEAFELLLKDSISPLPLHKSLVLLEQLNKFRDDRFYRHELLALAKSLVSSSNLSFGPEVGVDRKKKLDAPVIESWLNEIAKIANDIRSIKSNAASATVYLADSRQLNRILQPGSIDAVFTSPPYPNEKDYTRTTRLESVVLGFINNKSDLKNLKNKLLRSNTRNVYKNDDDDTWISENKKIQAIAEAIENRRIKLGKTSGFERLYGRVTKLYFGGMARHLAELRQFLKPGAYLGYVVGDQASYLQVMIRTGELLADIAKSLGYELVSIDLFRTRLATATKSRMREEVVVLRWPGKKKTRPAEPALSFSLHNLPAFLTPHK
ncbi:MAG: DNA methyltransferase [Candidatus Competibacteraceae bacterium]